MKLATAILSFLAVLIGITYSIATKLSKEDRQKAVSNVFRIATVVLPMAGAIAYLIFGTERLGLTLYVFTSVLVSVDYVRGTLPAGRVETLMLVLSWVATSFLLILYQLSRMLDVIGRLTDAVGRLVH